MKSDCDDSVPFFTSSSSFFFPMPTNPFLTESWLSSTGYKYADAKLNLEATDVFSDAFMIMAGVISSESFYEFFNVAS